MAYNADPFSWDEPPERIAACMACTLPDCMDSSKLCALKNITARKAHRGKTVDIEAESNKRIQESLKLPAIIKSHGHKIQEWCKVNKIKYNQLRLFEIKPPKSKTKLSIKISSALEREGIQWTGRHCNTV